MVYFHWHREIPLEEQATSSLRKNLRESRSLSLKHESSHILRKVTTLDELLAMLMSSTYTNKAIKEDSSDLIKGE